MLKDWRPEEGSNSDPLESYPLHLRLDKHKQHPLKPSLQSHTSSTKQSKNVTKNVTKIENL